MKQCSRAEEVSSKAKSECARLDAQKVSLTEHTTFRNEIVKHNDYMANKLDDTFNRMIDTEIYLDKYQPYNSFVQFTEVLHVTLSKKYLKKLEDFENVKLQNFLADILLDMGQ